MALTTIAEGTQTATIGTTHSLVTDTTSQVYVYVVDTSAMVNGDELILTINTIVRAAGAAGVAYQGVFKNIQTDVIKYSPPVPADISFNATLKQSAGTGRAFPWKVLKL